MRSSLRRPARRPESQPGDLAANPPSAAGSAVGLGNLWGFPYKTSQNGGAAFVLIYIACVLLIGFVTMLSEIYLGRRAQANPMTAYKMIHKNLGWCGLVAIVIPAFIICYYSVLGGWTTKYALNSFSGNAVMIAWVPATDIGMNLPGSRVKVCFKIGLSRSRARS